MKKISSETAAAVLKICASKEPDPRIKRAMLRAADWHLRASVKTN